jgi:hypothetical protein
MLFLTDLYFSTFFRSRNSAFVILVTECFILVECSCDQNLCSRDRKGISNMMEIL